MDRDAIIARLQETRQAVLDGFDLEPAVRELTYAPGKWSIRRILAHLADAELALYWRFARSVAEPGCSVEPFDQDEWADALGYSTRPNELDSTLFTGARDMLIHHVQNLSNEQLEQGFANHAEKGRMTGWDWAELASDHVEHHVRQIRAARDRVPWEPVVTANSWRYTGQPNPADAGELKSRS